MQTYHSKSRNMFHDHGCKINHWWAIENQSWNHGSIADSINIFHSTIWPNAPCVHPKHPQWCLCVHRCAFKRMFKQTVYRVNQWCFQCLLCCWFVHACVSLLWWCSKYPMCYKQIHSWVDIWDCTLEIKCQTCVNTIHAMYIHTSSTIWAEKKGRSTCACTLASPGYAYCRATKGARDVWNICIYLPRKSKDQTLPIGNRESFTWIIPKTILCLVLDFQGLCLTFNIYT